MSLQRRIIPALFPAALLVTAWAGINFTRDGGLVASIWPANALILAVLLRWPTDQAQRAFVILASAGVLMAANLIAHVHWLSALAFTAANLTEVAIAAYALRRHADPTAGLKSMMSFVGVAVLLGPFLTSVFAAALMHGLGDPAALTSTAHRWFVSHGLGMAIVGAFLLTISRPTLVRFDRAAKIRFAAAQLAVLAASVYVFLIASPPPLFLIAPFVVAAAMSHSQLGGATAVALASFIAILGASLGTGPAAVAQMSGSDPFAVTRLLLATMTFTVLPVSALLRRLEEYAVELEERRAKAQELNEIKTRLLAQVSHEIRSPMAGVTTLAGLMRDGSLGALTASQRETLDQIAASGAEVAELARDLTDAAVIQSGRARIELVPVSIAEAIAAAVAMAGFRTAQYGCVIETVPGESDQLYVAADPLRLRQILVNLLINGAKYGGQPPLVRIAARATATGVRFEVSDNGAGIAPERRERLFQDFERLGAESSDLDGAGLGLALSRQIAQLQHGRMGVEDGELGGARFWLELPVAARASAAA